MTEVFFEVIPLLGEISFTTKIKQKKHGNQTYTNLKVKELKLHLNFFTTNITINLCFKYNYITIKT